MKIVFDGRTIRPQRTGGGYFVERLLRALMAHDRRNEYLILLNDESVWKQWDVPASFRSLRVGADYESHPCGDLWERFALPRLLEREGAALFHGPAFRVPHTKCCCPTIATVYDLTCWRCASDYPWGFRRYMRWLLRRSCRSASAIIATSRATADDLRELLGVQQSKVHVIYGAADERFRPVGSPDRARLASIHPALSQPYILTVGTIEPRKRIDLLVEAYEKSRGLGSLSHSLVVVGKVGWKPESALQAMRQSSAAASIHHLGYAAEDDLIAIYQGADLFVCVSRCEGFGLPPLEAMACGVPVIVTTGGSLGETVGDGGVVMEDAAPGPLAEAIGAVLRDKDRRSALAAKALARASQFSWKATAEQTLLCYERVVASETSQ